MQRTHTNMQKEISQYGSLSVVSSLFTGKTIMEIDAGYEVKIFQPISKGNHIIEEYMAEIELDGQLIHCRFDKERICISSHLVSSSVLPCNSPVS